jgi:hypothetical protein
VFSDDNLKDLCDLYSKGIKKYVQIYLSPDEIEKLSNLFYIYLANAHNQLIIDEQDCMSCIQLLL